MAAKIDLNVLREELREQAYKDQNHVAIHLFAEADALREVIVELATNPAAVHEHKQ